jgi:hypothetical protein
MDGPILGVVTLEIVAARATLHRGLFGCRVDYISLQIMRHTQTQIKQTNNKRNHEKIKYRQEDEN